ncbi:MAG: phage tail length tape measure family protein [Victivallaceae bacterium]|nr:phage tail length tape measure family protein [Victivallaceae bacterium]
MAAKRGIGTLAVYLTADSTGVSKGVSQATKTLHTLAGAAAAAFSVNAIKNFARESFNAFGVQERNEKRLSGMLKATGWSANLSLAELKKEASSIQSVTMAGDEQVLQMQSALMAFPDIAGDAFKEATRLAIDSAEATGQSWSSTVQSIGRALSDPVKGVRGLRSIGVSLSEAELKNMKSLLELGKKREAQEVILSRLRGRFSGVAEAAADSTMGRSIQLGNAWGDLKESLGEIIAGVVGGSVGNLTKTLSEWAAKLHDAAPLIVLEIKNSFVKLREWWDKALAYFDPAIGWLKENFSDLSANCLTFFKQLLANLTAAVDILVKAFQRVDVTGLLGDLKRSGNDFGRWLGTDVMYAGAKFNEQVGLGNLNGKKGSGYWWSRAEAEQGQFYANLLRDTFKGGVLPTMPGVTLGEYRELTPFPGLVNPDYARRREEIERASALDRAFNAADYAAELQRRADESKKGGSGVQNKLKGLAIDNDKPLFGQIAAALSGSLAAYQAKLATANNPQKVMQKTLDDQLKEQIKTNALIAAGGLELVEA